ncbi:MAG: ribonuclease III [Verrucomicrobiota bacterium]
MNALNKLEKQLGYSFKDPSLLELALTHPSLAHDRRLKQGDNQRLEYLGDAVLQMTLTYLLYRSFPDYQEGQLTQLRASAVNRKALEKIANYYSLGDFILLSRGELKNQGRAKASNLADAMEAVIGALFLDAGYEFTQRWIDAVFSDELQQLSNSLEIFNPKGALQERLQAQGKSTPDYELVEESGPDHAKSYLVRVISEGVELGRGSGSSKKAAESSAALNALENKSTS